MCIVLLANDFVQDLKHIFARLIEARIGQASDLSADAVSVLAVLDMVLLIAVCRVFIHPLADIDRLVANVIELACFPCAKDGLALRSLLAKGEERDCDRTITQKERHDCATTGERPCFGNAYTGLEHLSCI